MKMQSLKISISLPRSAVAHSERGVELGREWGEEWGSGNANHTFLLAKFKCPLQHTLPVGWKITLNDTPRNPITGTDTVINKHRGQSPSCHLPAVQKQGAEMKFYSRLVETALTSSRSQRRAGIQDCFSCLFCWPLWKFFGSSHPPRHHQTPDLGLWELNMKK